jgi:hypothetical protein
MTISPLRITGSRPSRHREHYLEVEAATDDGKFVVSYQTKADPSDIFLQGTTFELARTPDVGKVIGEADDETGTIHFYQIEGQAEHTEVNTLRATISYQASNPKPALHRSKGKSKYTRKKKARRKH